MDIEREQVHVRIMETEQETDGIMETFKSSFRSIDMNTNKCKTTTHKTRRFIAEDKIDFPTNTLVVHFDIGGDWYLGSENILIEW